MKRLFFSCICIAAFAFSTTKILDDTKAQATANKEHGLYIFTDCRPVAEYEVLGTLTSKRVSADVETLKYHGLSYDQLKTEIFRQLQQKKNKSKYDSASAIIVYPEDQKADIIKFK